MIKNEKRYEPFLGNTAIVMNSEEEKLELFNILDKDGWEWPNGMGLLDINWDPSRDKDYGSYCISLNDMCGVGCGNIEWYQRKHWDIITAQEFEDRMGIIKEKEEEIIRKKVTNILYEVQLI